MSSDSNQAQATTWENDGSPPAAPSDLEAEAVSSQQIRLKWRDNSAYETGFLLQRTVDGFASIFEITLEAGITEYDNIGLDPDVTYSYRIRAKNSVGFSDFSNVASAKTWPVTLQAPSELKAQALVSNQIHLSWVDRASDEDGYEVQRALGEGNAFRVIASLEAGAVSYVDTGLDPETVFSYRVRATKGADTSDFSNVASTETLPGPPLPALALSAEATSSTTIRLSWLDQSEREDGFFVQRKDTEEGEFVTLGAVDPNKEIYSDEGLTPYTRYWYLSLIHI